MNAMAPGVAGFNRESTTTTHEGSLDEVLVVSGLRMQQRSGTLQ